MTKNLAKRPAEIFGYPIGNQSDAAQDARRKHWCPFQENQCDKKMGVCSALLHESYSGYGFGVLFFCQFLFSIRSDWGLPRWIIRLRMAQPIRLSTC